MTRAAPVIALLAAACSHPSTTASPQAPKIAMSLDAPAEAALPKSPDVSREVMAFVVLADGQRVLRELVPEGQGGDLKKLQMQTALSMGLDPVVGEVLDLRKPAAIAALNPMLLARGGVRPFVALLPVVATPGRAFQRFSAAFASCVSPCGTRYQGGRYEGGTGRLRRRRGRRRCLAVWSGVRRCFSAALVWPIFPSHWSPALV